MDPSEGRRHRTTIRGLLVRSPSRIGVGTVLMAWTVFFGLTFPGGGPTLAAVPSACAAGGGNRVAVVIDFGTVTGVPGAPSGMVVECVTVTDRATGLDVLRAAGVDLRIERGLICAIAHYPAPSEGCAERQGDHYRYWSYWSGSDAGWTYQNTGPATWRARSDRVEGWRFVDAGIPGQGTGLVPPRDIRRSDGATVPGNVASNICTVAPSTPAATQPPRTAPPTVTAPAGGSSPDSGGVTSPGPSPGDPMVRPTTTGAPGGTTTTAPDRATTTTMAPDGSSKDAIGSVTDVTSGESAEAVGAADVVLSDDRGGGSAIARYLGIGVAGVVVTALGVVGVRRSRRASS